MTRRVLGRPGSWGRAALWSIFTVFGLSTVILAFSANLPSAHIALAEGNGNGNGNGHGNGGGNGNGNGHSDGNGNAGGNGNANGNANGKGKGAAPETPGSPQPTGVPADATPVDTADVNDHERALRHELVVTNATSALPAYAAAQGLTIINTRQLPNLGLSITRLAVPDGMSVTTAKQELIARFPDAIVDYNHVYRQQTSLSIPAIGYAARQIGWSGALRACGGSDLRIGLLDTRIDQAIPILAAARITQTDIAIEDAEQQRAGAGHGTGIAALLVGQKAFGLLPDAALYAADIFITDQNGDPAATATAFAIGLDWLIKSRVLTVNVSLSGPPDRLMDLAIRQAGLAGVRLVAAVGNDAAIDSPRFPAAYPGVVGVTAIDERRQRFEPANQGDFVQLAAPGVDIWLPIDIDAIGEHSLGSETSFAPSTEGVEGAGTGGTYVSGTSFAAPYVTAILAASGNDLARLTNQALDLGPHGRDSMFGYGLVQAAACAAKPL